MGDPTQNRSPKGLRQVSRASQVYEDVEAYTASADYAAADLEATRAAAIWGSPVDVRGRTEVQLFVEFTKVAGQTDLHVAMQGGFSDTTVATHWYDRHADFAQLWGDGTTVPTTPNDLDLDVSGFANGTHRIVLMVRSIGNFMRFKPWGEGTLTAAYSTIGVMREQG